MTINIQTGMIRTNASGEMQVAEAVQPTANANLDALKRSLASLKFVPQISEVMSFDDNEIEVSRAKAVLDQMASQAEMLMTRDEFVKLLEEVIQSSGVEIQPEVKQTLVTHIQNMKSWKFDVLSMPAPQGDTSEEEIASFLEKLTEMKQPQNKQVTEQGDLIGQDKTAPDVAGASEEGVINKMDRLKYHKDIGRPDDIKPILLNALQDNVQNNPELASSPQIKEIEKQVVADIVEQAQPAEAANAGFVLDKIQQNENSHGNHQQKAQPQRIGDAASQNGTNVNLGIGDALYALGSGAGHVAGKAKSAADSIFSTLGFGSAAEERKQKAAVRGLRKTIGELQAGLKKCATIDKKIEEEFIKGGGTVEIDADGKWTPETIVAMKQDKNLNPYFRQSDSEKNAMAIKTEEFKQQAEMVDLKPGEGVKPLGEQVSDLNESLDKGLKSDNVPSSSNENEVEQKKWMETLLELVKKLIDMIRSIFQGKRNANEASKERVEPSFESERAAPQP